MSFSVNKLTECTVKSVNMAKISCEMTALPSAGFRRKWGVDRMSQVGAVLRLTE
jgi:hypothetical protein